MDMEDPFAAAGDGNDPFQSVEAPGDDYNAIQDPQAAAPADAGDMKTGDQPPRTEFVSPETAADVFGGVQADTQDAGNDAEEENVTFLSVWEEQRAKTLQERQQKEEAAKQEIAKTATQEIQKHLEERKEQITQNQKDNRAAEADFKEDMEKVFKDGTIWQQVGKMVSLKADGGGRPERMRDILIQLKNAKS